MSFINELKRRNVIKVGIGIGAETGEGALRVGGKTVDYYRTTSGSVGLQLGAQAKSIVIAFMTKESLAAFRDSSGWQVGIDGSVALIDLGAGKRVLDLPGEIGRINVAIGTPSHLPSPPPPISPSEIARSFIPLTLPVNPA